MQHAHNNHELITHIHEWKQQGQSIAFVPTMGNLHDGHLSLLKLGRQRADKLVSSIFVNPMQFAPHEDLDKYPRTLEQDCKALMEQQCDLVYTPTEQELYPRGMAHMSVVQVADVTTRFEGEFRPGHLNGVSTIVLKLFNLVQPDIAVFGKKDYQQWRMIEKMVSDLNLSISVIAGETIREADGLALSSRNQYLDETQRQRAATLYQQLQHVAQQLRQGAIDLHSLSTQARQVLTTAGFEVDYFDICQRHTLRPAHSPEKLVILAAARLGSTRLIDNIEV